MFIKSSVTGQTYHVTWQYLERWKGSGEPCFTSCLISKINSDKTKDLLITGKAECSWKDQFDKNIGRKLSLSRALITRVPVVKEPTEEDPQRWEPIFPKEQRLDFWNEYFKMHGKIE